MCMPVIAACVGVGAADRSLRSTREPRSSSRARRTVTTYRSSDWAERAFCKICGSHLYFRTIETGGYSISPGLFEDEAAFALTEEIFIDQKPDFYDFAGEREKLTEAEVIAKFAPEN